jgi:hypothetical protein
MKQAKAEMFKELEKHTINVCAIGLCFLKLLISNTHVEMIVVVNMLCCLISKVPIKIVERCDNITKFM